MERWRESEGVEEGEREKEKAQIWHTCDMCPLTVQQKVQYSWDNINRMNKKQNKVTTTTTTTTSNSDRKSSINRKKAHHQCCDQQDHDEHDEQQQRMIQQ